MFLITGGTGFVGRSLIESAFASGQKVIAPVRRSISTANDINPKIKWLSLGDFSRTTNWITALEGVDAVVHCAARAHVSSDEAGYELSAFREINVDITLRLAQQAAISGVQRFVFISSIGVNGNLSDAPFNELSASQPYDPYSISKLEAEQALLNLSANTCMEVVIIRPPLVYGPGAPGNFGSLVRWALRGLPLPLGAVHNKRSLVALDNLVSLVLLCADRDRSPQAANQVFVVADGEDVSTSTLLRKVSRAAGRPSRLLPVPARLLRAGASLLGKRAVADRLLGDLQVDATKARTLLGWRPVVTMDAQLAKMFEHKD